MTPTLNINGRAVVTDRGVIPWDATNNRPLDHEGEAGRIWEALKIEYKITTPDPYVPPPVPVPQTISDRQFVHALKIQGVLTHQQALDFVATGKIPPTLAAVIAAIPTKDDREDAELLLTGATTFDRKHPMTLALASGMGWTPKQLDELWAMAVSL